MKKNVIRLLFALVALLTSTGMLAENKLWVEPFSVEKNKPVQVPIQMINDSSAAAVQFTVVLPHGITIDTKIVQGSAQYVYRNSERLNNTQQFMCTRLEDICTYDDEGNLVEVKEAYKCAIFSLGKETFIGTEGPIAFFDVKINSLYLPGSESSVFSGIACLQDIMITDASGDRLECNDEAGVDVAIDNIQLKVAGQTDTIYTTPKSQIEFPVVLNNKIDLLGLQMDIQLPEGFSMENEFVNSDRLSNGATISMTQGADNTYRLVLVDLVGGDDLYSWDGVNYAIRNTGNGVIFTAKINTPDSIAEESVIDIQNVIASAYINRKEIAVNGEGASLTVINENVALDEANEIIANLRKCFTLTIDSIAVVAPDVKDKFTGTEIINAIDSLENSVKEAYANHTLTPNYDEVMAPADAIVDAMEQLIEDAKTAQAAEEKRVADNKAAYDAVVTAIAALQKHLDESVAVIDSIYADYKDVDAIKTVQDSIDKAKTDSQAALDSVAAEGIYSYELDEEGISNAIDALVADAKAAKEKAEADAEAKRQADNKAAYEADTNKLDSLYVHYREVVAQIQTDYKNFEDVSAELAVRNSLDAAKDEMAKAYKAVELEGIYEYVLDVEGLGAAIDKLLDDAKAKEAERVAANKEAYDAVIAEIAVVQGELDAAIAEIAEKYPEYNATVEALAITKLLNDAEKEADAAYAAVEKEGVFAYEFDAQAARDLIAAMMVNAEASGVDFIIAEAEAGNARIFTLDGAEHARPVVGKVNVIVRKNGSVSKIMVK